MSESYIPGRSLAALGLDETDETTPADPFSPDYTGMSVPVRAMAREPEPWELDAPADSADDEDWEEPATPPPPAPASEAAPVSAPPPPPAPAAPAKPEGVAALLDEFSDLLEEEGEIAPPTLDEKISRVYAEARAAKAKGDRLAAIKAAKELRPLVAEKENATLLQAMIDEAQAVKARLDGMSGLSPEEAARRDAIREELKALNEELKALNEAASKAKSNNPEVEALRKEVTALHKKHMDTAFTLTPYPRGFPRPGELFGFGAAARAAGSRSGSPTSRKAREAGDGKPRETVWTTKKVKHLLENNSLMEDGKPIVPTSPEDALTLTEIWDRVAASKVMEHSGLLEPGSVFNRVTTFTPGENSNSSLLHKALGRAGWKLIHVPGVGDMSDISTQKFYFKEAGFLSTK